MKKLILIFSLLCMSFLQTNVLKADLQNELIRLTNALENLEIKLTKYESPLKEIFYEFQPLRYEAEEEETPPLIQKKPRPRPASVNIPRAAGLSEAEDILRGFAKAAALKPERQIELRRQQLEKTLPACPVTTQPAPQQPSLARTTPAGGIPTAKPKPQPSRTPLPTLAERKKSFYQPEVEEPEKKVERQTSRKRPQSERFERPPLEGYEIPKKTINWVNLKHSIQQLESLPSTGPEQTAIKKLEAKATLEGIESLVKKASRGNLQNKQRELWEAIHPILKIDPLLIQPAINILRNIYLNASEANPKLYQLMTDLYENRISFLENEFKKIKPGFKLAKGIRDDIDEGLTYPIEISGEVQDAQIKAQKDDDPRAKDFFNATNDQWKRLLLLLRELSEQQKEALREEGIDVDQYISNIEQQKSGTYCRLETDRGCLPYKSIYEELDDLVKTIDYYNEVKHKNLRNHKAFAIQNIVNKLKAFTAYSTDKNFCQICLDKDTADSSKKEAKEKFDIIVSFIETLLTDKRDSQLENALITIRTARADEQQRRSRVEKEGVGSTYF